MTEFEKVHLKLSDISKAFNKVADQLKKQGAEMLKVSKSLADLERNVEDIKNKMATKGSYSKEGEQNAKGKNKV